MQFPTGTAPIFADIETGPSQDRSIIQHIKAGIELDLSAKVAELKAETFKTPKNYTKPETIDAYIAEKEAEREAKVRDAIAKATEQYDEAWRKTSLDGAFGQVMTCSLGFGDDNPIGLYGEDWQHPDYEIRLLGRINTTVENYCGRKQGQRLVGHNIVGFDRKFLRQRGIIRGVKMHPMFSKEVKPWDSDLVYDTMTQWTGDARSGVKLDKLCLVLGIPLKGSELDEDIDGSLVWDFIRDGKIAKVSRYCDYDVIRCRAVYARLNFLPMPPLGFFDQPELDDIPV